MSQNELRDKLKEAIGWYMDAPARRLVHQVIAELDRIEAAQAVAPGGSEAAIVRIGTEPWNCGLAVADLNAPLPVGTKLYAHPPQAQAGAGDAQLVRALAAEYGDQSIAQWFSDVELADYDRDGILRAAIKAALEASHD